MKRGDEVERDVHRAARTHDGELDFGLFGQKPVPLPEAHARNSDPETSHVAAQKASAGVMASQRDVLHALRSHGPMIDEQLYQACVYRGSPASSSRIRSARSELVAMGYVKVAGTGTTKRGGVANIHEITEKGLAYLRETGGL